MKTKNPQTSRKPRKPKATTALITQPLEPNHSALDSRVSKIVSKPATVVGRIHPLYREDSSEKILYIATNHSQVEMACLMSEHSSFDSVIYSDGFDFHEHSLTFTRPSFTTTLKGVAAILKRVTKIVTYIGQVNPNIKKEYRTLLSSALKLEIPIIELPHGLVQSGYNLDDTSRLINLSSYYEGIGSSLPSIASLRLGWYGKYSVGYPRSVVTKQTTNRTVPKFTLITTNTNWFLYSVEEKRIFFNSVFKYAEANPNHLFIWSPHPAETNEQTYSHSISALRPANVLIYGLMKDIYFDGIENSNDLAAFCEDGISTVTTCILEYEMHNKSVHIFSTPGVAQIIERFHKAKTFTSIADLNAPAAPVHTGMLERYDPLKFDEYLSLAPKSDPRNSIYLDLV